MGAGMLGIRPGIKRFEFHVQGLSSYCGHKLGALEPIPGSVGQDLGIWNQLGTGIRIRFRRWEGGPSWVLGFRTIVLGQMVNLNSGVTSWGHTSFGWEDWV